MIRQIGFQSFFSLNAYNSAPHDRPFKQAPPLQAPSPRTLNFVDNVSRLKFDVERVVHIHGGNSPYSDGLASVGRSRSTNWLDAAPEA